MTAGLPKFVMRLVLFLACLVTLFVVTGLVFGQEDPTGTPTFEPSTLEPPTLETPTLEDATAAIEGSELLSDEQKAGLIGAVSTAVNEAYLTIEEAFALLDIAQLDQLTDEDEASFTASALETVLAALNAGEVDFEGASTSLAEAIESGSEDGLDDSLVDLTTPAGILNAIGNAAAKVDYDDAALLQQVQQLISDGVPPGIVLRVTKDALRSGLEPSEIEAQLDELGALIAGGVSPGNAANEVTGKGQNRNREQELNQNTNQEPNDEPEVEQEGNRNSPQGNGQGNSNKENKGKGKKD